MANNRYMKFILSVTIVWLFTVTFLLYGIAVQKINIEKQKLNFEEWKAGKRKPLRLLGEKTYTYTPDKPYQIVKLDNPYRPLARFNQQTGLTEYWSTEGGGWVVIKETGLVTAISPEEKAKRREIISRWYNRMSPNFKSKVSYELFETDYIDVPSHQLEEFVEYYDKNPNEWETKFLKP